MTLLKDAIDAKKFDARMIERNLRRGGAQVDDLNKLLKALPDDTANAEWVNLEVLFETEDKESR